MSKTPALVSADIGVEAVLKPRLLAAMRSNIILQPLTLILGVAGSVVVARVLGPELLAVVHALGAIVVPLTVFLDFGLGRSLPKLLPDVSVRYGSKAAEAIARKILKLKLTLVLLGLGLLLVLQAHGVVPGPFKIATGSWTIPLVCLSLLLTTVSGVWESSAIASFHHGFLNRISLLSAALLLAVTVIVALAYRDPYRVVLAAQSVLILRLALLARWGRYDLDNGAGKDAEPPVSWHALLRRYGSYSGTTYCLFLFNRFVFSAGLVVWLMSSAYAEAAAVANAALALTIVGRVFDLANLPVNQIQGPLLARLYAEGDERRFAQTQHLLVGVLCITSGALAIVVVGLGPTVLSLLYGSSYGSGVSWAVCGSLVAMLSNPFSLGSTTLLQRNRFSSLFVGLGVSSAVLWLGTWASLQWLSPSELGLGCVLTVLGSRAAFFLVTDLWCDRSVFGWTGTSIKIRALAATALATAGMVAGGWNDSASVVWGFPLAALVWLFAWRVTGGLGSSLRLELEKILGSGLRPLVRYL
jgi:O-antigen/teichoic acid export membrane protein